ncbi:N-acetylmuramoyl-L-alanine amidase [Phaeacidiphilus oryzae]|uniref:N-acetylmuramoyl-L-alanine amidase n=1 Tax=Phaeacidiphilus oryzae TaxID=348818 RepID=UPI00068C3867|nr:peptidoglycan recognition family protein [Phaeacidiphilus oryzae]
MTSTPAQHPAQRPAQHPAHPATYDLADRPTDLPLTTLVLHDTEETHADTLRIFTDPASRVSAHYLIRSQDGALTQLVPDRHVARHAGNWYVNQHSLGIEHEGYADAGHTWYTDAMYRASAALIGGLAARYGIPLDRFHLLGHDNVPAPTPAHLAGMHVDPGPLWDWARLLELLGRPVVPTAEPGSPLREIAHNSVLHKDPDGSSPIAGAVSAGQRFALVERAGEWTALWYEGSRAWLYDPGHDPAALPAAGGLLRPRGDRPIQVFGRPLPAPECFPPGVPRPEAVPLPFRLAPHQAYAHGGFAPAVHLYAPGDRPADRAVVRDPETAARRWLIVQTGHRIGYVRAAEAELFEIPAGP